MPIITFKYQGRVYQRLITRKQGFYSMYSKNVEYWFAKDLQYTSKFLGWHIVNGKSLPEFMMELLSTELEKLYLEPQNEKPAPN